MADFILILFGIIFLIGIILAYFIGSKTGSAKKEKYWQDALPGHRKDAINRSRAVLAGHFSEQLAPFLPDFPYNPNEARFIGKPIDFLVFKGMDNKEIDEIVFVEVKSGKSKLSNIEKSLKEAVKSGRVKWEEYRAPEKLSEKHESDKMEEV